VNRVKIALLAALVLLCVVDLARADSLNDTFTRGNAAYARGDFAAAITEYETLLESGVMDAAVSYNLAAAHGSLGHYGQAIRYFERSLALAPGDEGAERGLKLARDALGERQAREQGEAIVAERPPLSSALFAGFSEDTLAWVLLVSAWGFSVALLALRYARAEALRLGLGIGVALFVLGSAIGGFGLWAKADFGAAGQRAIVLRDHVPLRDGPDTAARSSRELSEGESLRVLSSDGRFARVLLGRGREGFVAASDIGEI
jgi:tetratricopeptide (TPR) repeat protein